MMGRNSIGGFFSSGIFASSSSSSSPRAAESRQVCAFYHDNFSWYQRNSSILSVCWSGLVRRDSSHLDACNSFFRISWRSQEADHAVVHKSSCLSTLEHPLRFMASFLFVDLFSGNLVPEMTSLMSTLIVLLFIGCGSCTGISLVSPRVCQCSTYFSHWNGRLYAIILHIESMGFRIFMVDFVSERRVTMMWLPFEFQEITSLSELMGTNTSHVSRYTSSGIHFGSLRFYMRC